MRIWGKSMGKRILIGSMLVLVMLLVMPSIPAIQMKTIDDGIDKRESELLTKLQDLDIEKIKDLLNEKSRGYTPLFLTLLLHYIMLPRVIRGLFLFFISVEWDQWGGNKIIHPILYMRGIWLLRTAMAWLLFWQSIYDFMGWNWHIVPYT